MLVNECDWTERNLDDSEALGSLGHYYTAGTGIVASSEESSWLCGFNLPLLTLLGAVPSELESIFDIDEFDERVFP